MSLVFAFSILGSSVWAVTRVTPTMSPVNVVTPTPTPALKIDYTLPYPGILPDSPLYSIKMLRDRLVLALTIDPLQKIEKLLLYADKRLGAGKVLIEGNKVELGVTTITKGEKYLEEAINLTVKTKKSGKNTQPLSQRLSTASLKHAEVLEELSLKTADEAKTIILESKQKTVENAKLLSE